MLHQRGERRTLLPVVFVSYTRRVLTCPELRQGEPRCSGRGSNRHRKRTFRGRDLARPRCGRATSGTLAIGPMVAPHRHVGDFGALDDEEKVEIYRLARWSGDTNFMSVLADLSMLP